MPGWKHSLRQRPRAAWPALADPTRARVEDTAAALPAGRAADVVILVDTSVWIDHFRKSSSALQRLLLGNEVLCHPFVVGELACGSLRHRDSVLDLLRRLPRSPAATDEEVLRFVEDRSLFGRGLGWVDVHLAVSALLGQCGLWTADRKLRASCHRLGIDYDPIR